VTTTQTACGDVPSFCDDNNNSVLCDTHLKVFVNPCKNMKHGFTPKPSIHWNKITWYETAETTHLRKGKLHPDHNIHKRTVLVTMSQAHHSAVHLSAASPALRWRLTSTITHTLASAFFFCQWCNWSENSKPRDVPLSGFDRRPRCWGSVSTRHTEEVDTEDWGVGPEHHKRNEQPV
jgi:hypothetical protein